MADMGSAELLQQLASQLPEGWAEQLEGKWPTLVTFIVGQVLAKSRQKELTRTIADSTTRVSVCCLGCCCLLPPSLKPCCLLQAVQMQPSHTSQEHTPGRPSCGGQQGAC